ncbi:MAG: LysR family transcriptional regulator [Clostridia bacterium]|nr:LysR family transcriptional regulator [Clostridia bacterium]
MDIQKLKYFYTTAELEHITRAAEILHISQPSLTQAIHSLEDELEVPLFQRSGRKIVLTEFGRHLKGRLDTLLPEFDNLSAEMAKLKNAVTKTVKLNILAASTFVINTIMEYKQNNPDVIFDFEQNDLNPDCDILITTNGRSTAAPKNYLRRCVKKETIYLAVPKASCYAGKEAVELREVQNESFIMLSSTRLFGAICSKFCSIAGFQPKILFESDSPTAVQNIISMGAGIAFWPEYSWGKLQNESLTLVGISSPECRRDLIIELHERLPRSVYAEDFYNFLLKKI